MGSRVCAKQAIVQQSGVAFVQQVRWIHARSIEAEPARRLPSTASVEKLEVFQCGRLELVVCHQLVNMRNMHVENVVSMSDRRVAVPPGEVVQAVQK